jgi:APA family basic amino acid/polyamine antiporter
MIISLPTATQLSALGWMVLGLIIYLTYSSKNSRLGKMGDALPKASDFEKQP